MCFFGFLHSGEAVLQSETGYDEEVHLSVGDVRVDNVVAPQFVEVRIKASKTDPFQKGVSVYLGRTDSDICPVAAVLGYMVNRGTSPGPVSSRSNGHPLTRARLVGESRSALRQAGIDAARYAGHNFRSGAATTASLVGLPDSMIKTLGRWESAAYTLYIQTPPPTLCSVSRALIT